MKQLLKYGFVLICTVLFVDCRQKTNKTQITGNFKEPVLSETNSDTTMISDSSSISLFDGKTLEGWEITEFGTGGPVMVSEENIILSYGDGCTGITWKGDFPKNNYEISVEAMKKSGNDFFCGMTFPAGESYCSFIVGGWGGPVVGLSCIDGADASDNQTKILKKFELNQWYAIKVRVTSKNISAWIDNEKVVDFNTAGHLLSIRPEVELSKPFGIASWNTTSALRKIILKEL